MYNSNMSREYKSNENINEILENNFEQFRKIRGIELVKKVVSQ